MYRMKLKKILAVIMVLFMTAAMLPGMTAHAASDVDFTIAVNTDISYISGDTIATTIQINNQTEKGYIDLKLFLTFDPDALNCLSIFENVDGFSTKIEERDGQTGLLITYVSPDGSPSVQGIKYLPIEFAVITGVASGDYTLSLKVLECYGLDDAQSKTDAVQKEGVLTLSMAKDKKLKIVETNDNSVGNGTGDGSTPNYYYSEPTVNQEVDNKEKDKGGSSVGRVLLMIFGAIVVFAAGVVVGFILCQKRMLEDGYGRDSEDYTQREYSGSRSRFGDISGGFQRSVYDEEEESADDYYNERLSGKRSPSRRPSVLDDDDIDTSYFGRAAETQLGSSRTAYDDDADEFTPRRYRGAEAEAPAEEYGSFDFLGSHRRERDDDGYGSFGGEDTSSPVDDDADDDDYFSDRRRYR